jgi:hypothetical protein
MISSSSLMEVEAIGMSQFSTISCGMDDREHESEFYDLYKLKADFYWLQDKGKRSGKMTF